MRFLMITGSRADRGAIDVVAASLRARQHEVNVLSVGWRALPVAGRSEACVLASTAMGVTSRAVEMTPHDFDWAVVHGDRYEVLAATLGAHMMGLPIVHVGGGDLTEGSQDDCYRGAITKLSHLHLVAYQDAADRLLMMGEEDARIFVVGDPELDRLRDFKGLTRPDLLAAVGIPAGLVQVPLALVLLHPTTLGMNLDAALMGNVAWALSRLGVCAILVGPGADPGANVIAGEMAAYAAANPTTVVYKPSLPPDVFLSALRWADVMVGNSSSGIIEAPVFGTPVVNVGDRQKGRPRAPCVADVGPTADEIMVAIGAALQKGRYEKPSSLFGDGRSGPRVVRVLEAAGPSRAFLRKRQPVYREAFGSRSLINALDRGPLPTFDWERELDAVRNAMIF